MVVYGELGDACCARPQLRVGALGLLADGVAVCGTAVVVGVRWE